MSGSSGSVARCDVPYLPAREEPIEFGVHDEVADHYGVPRGSDVERATTLDFVVAAAGG